MKTEMHSRQPAWICFLFLLTVFAFFSGPVAAHALSGPAIVQAEPDVPLLTVSEPVFGDWLFQGTAAPMVEFEVPCDAVLNFTWLGDVAHYGGTILGYRYGWDVTDPDDFNDPGWMTPFTPDLLIALPHSFGQGTHSLHVVVRDILGAETRAGFLLYVQPPVATDVRTWGEVRTMFR